MATSEAGAASSSLLRADPAREGTDGPSRMLLRADPRQSVEFLPEPSPRPRPLTIISVDDHVVEAPSIFEGRLPKKLASEAPRVVEADDGAEAWLIDGKLNREIGAAAVAGRPRSTTQYMPTRFEHMIPGCYVPSARVKDMDIGGVAASVLFPSALGGFAGTRFNELSNRELGLALVRAWNSWLMEEWVDPYPDRFIACQLAWLNDVKIAAAEIRANADRGFKAVSFPEAPQKLGLPSFHSGYWDPFLAACEETETVMNLHVGSASFINMTADDAPYDELPIMFPLSAMFATVDVLYARIPLRFPNLRVALSEGGIGWVPGLIDRLEHLGRHFEYLERLWPDEEGRTPLDLMRQNFWFCALDDPTGFAVAHRIGIGHVMIEVDYPHEDSTWPDTQGLMVEQLSSLSADEIADVTYRNAARLYRHDVSGWT